jgi:hypothetical protein
MKSLLQSQRNVREVMSCTDSKLIATGSGAKHRKAADSIDNSGVLDDIIVTLASGSTATQCEDKMRDLNAFFDEAQLITLNDGSMKLYRICKNCLSVTSIMYQIVFF